MKKTVLITGANSGFGYLTSLKFARNGYKVFATTRNIGKEGVISMNKIVEKEELDIEWLVLDVTNIESIKREMAKVKSLDVLVNNAGFGVVGPVEKMTEQDICLQLSTNFIGPFRMIKECLPLLKKSIDPYIINVSSIAGIIALAGNGIYGASKHALEAMTEALRVEMDMYGIKVAMVEPGSYKTDFTKNKKVVGKFNIGRKGAWFWRLGRYLRKPFRNPQEVANRIYRLSQMKNPPLRSIIGIDAKILMFMKKLLPARMWDRSIRFFLKK